MEISGFLNGYAKITDSMDEPKTDTEQTQPIDDVKPPIPDATSTGAEFSEDLGPEPFPPKEISGIKKQPQEPAVKVAPPEEPEEEPTEASDTPEEPISGPAEPLTAEPQPATRSTDATASHPQTPTQDNGTHRSHPHASNKGLAALIGFAGIALCGFVVYVYLATNS